MEKNRAACEIQNKMDNTFPPSRFKTSVSRIEIRIPELCLLPLPSLLFIDPLWPRNLNKKEDLETRAPLDFGVKIKSTIHGEVLPRPFFHCCEGSRAAAGPTLVRVTNQLQFPLFGIINYLR